MAGRATVPVPVDIWCRICGPIGCMPDTTPMVRVASKAERLRKMLDACQRDRHRLLKACEGLLAVSRGTGRDTRTDRAMVKAEAAIAKVKGKP